MNKYVRDNSKFGRTVLNVRRRSRPGDNSRPGSNERSGSKSQERPKSDLFKKVEVIDKKLEKF